MSIARPAIVALGLVLSACIIVTDDPQHDDDHDETSSSTGGDASGSTQGSDPDGTGGAPAMPACELDGLHSVERPWSDDDARTFTYWFRVVEGQGDGPLVVFMPGGPGLGSTGSPPPLPPDVDVLLTDPRGVGCNASPDGTLYPPAFFSTAQFAGDVVAAIASTGTDDYILYGHSYGTVLATVVASTIEDAGLPPPRAVVLEGIAGHWVDEDESPYEATWAQVRDAMSPEIQAVLRADPPPLGLAPEVWGEAISTILSQFSPESLATLLADLAPGADSTTLAATISELGSLPSIRSNPEMLQLFRAVACVELFERSMFEYQLVAGELAPTFDACADQSVTRPYDAAEHLVTAPIFYFEGSADPATIYPSAYHHFESQTATDRVFVTVDGVGHLPLQWALAPECGLDVWQAVLAGGEGLDVALAGCTHTGTIEARVAGM